MLSIRFPGLRPGLTERPFQGREHLHSVLVERLFQGREHLHSVPPGLLTERPLRGRKPCRASSPCQPTTAIPPVGILRPERPAPSAQAAGLGNVVPTMCPALNGPFGSPQSHTNRSSHSISYRRSHSRSSSWKDWFA